MISIATLGTNYKPHAGRALDRSTVLFGGFRNSPTEGVLAMTPSTRNHMQTNKGLESLKDDQDTSKLGVACCPRWGTRCTG